MSAPYRSAPMDSRRFVPFRGFQFVVLLAQTFVIVFHERVHRGLDWVLRDSGLKTEFKRTVKSYIVSIPLFVLLYYHLFYDAFSLTNLRIGTSEEASRALNNALLILGSYGIVQVLAQDTGTRTATTQRDIVRSKFFFLLALGSAYAITQNRSHSLVAVIVYYHLLYAVGRDERSNVCFEDI